MQGKIMIKDNERYGWFDLKDICMRANGSIRKAIAELQKVIITGENKMNEIEKIIKNYID